MIHIPSARYRALGRLQAYKLNHLTDGGANLTERPLGEFEVSVEFAGPTTPSCTIRLTDSNSDDPVKVSVRGLIVFFR